MSQIKGTNVVWHEGHVNREHRETLLNQKGVLVWLTGLSSSGKSTVAFNVEQALVGRGHLAYVLDGDNIRHGLNNNLGFSAGDRTENIRRIGEVGKLFTDSGVVTLASFVSPYAADRAAVRALMGEGDFIEVFVDTPLEECECRDTKGLYAKARRGELKNFTGIDSPYEPPENPEVQISTNTLSPEQATLKLLSIIHNEARFL